MDYIGVLQRGLGLIYGRFRAHPYEDYMAVPVNWPSCPWWSSE